MSEGTDDAVTALEARKIARSEVQRFTELLLGEIGRTGLRDDGAMNQHDLWECIKDALRDFDLGETA